MTALGLPPVIGLIVFSALVIHVGAVALSYATALYVSEDGFKKTTMDFCTMDPDELVAWVILAGYLLPFLAAHAASERIRARI